jgi:predicted N-acyltransferase
VVIRTFTGDAIPRSHLDRMYGFYEGTNEKFGPWAAKYLNREFFVGLGQGFRHRLLLVAGYREGAEEPIGMSLLLVKGDRLLGRYWGASTWVDSLHFNLCYYSPIEWAIGNGVRRFDPGAGSPHKVRRGFRAVPNHSLHKFMDPRLNRILRLNIEKINRMEQDQIEELNRGLPLRP